MMLKMEKKYVVCNEKTQAKALEKDFFQLQIKFIVLMVIH